MAQASSTRSTFLFTELAEGQCVPGAVALRRRPGQHVVDAQRRHRDPA